MNILRVLSIFFYLLGSCYAFASNEESFSNKEWPDVSFSTFLASINGSGKFYFVSTWRYFSFNSSSDVIVIWKYYSSSSLSLLPLGRYCCNHGLSLVTCLEANRAPLHNYFLVCVSPSNDFGFVAVSDVCFFLSRICPLKICDDCLVFITNYNNYRAFCKSLKKP